MKKVFINKCTQRTECLMNLAVEANQTYKVLMKLRHALVNDYEILNISPAFYGSVIDISMQSLFVDLSKMYDETDLTSTDSCYSILDKIKNNLRLLDERSFTTAQMVHIDYEGIYYKDFQSVTEIVNYYLEKITEKEGVIKYIKKLRSKYYAHIDIPSHNNLDKLFSKYSVSFTDIEDLLVLFSNICIALYKYYKDTTYLPVLENYNDFDNTVRCLKSYKRLSEKYDDYD